MYKELIDALVSECGFITDFSPEEEQQAQAAARRHDLTNRFDCRKSELITIDGEDAHDFDDAVSCAVLPDGDIHLTVAIADVSAYVAAGSALDAAAYQRATSVYLPDRVIPMLPTVLSNGACSLRPDEDRLCLCCAMEITPAAVIRRYRFFRAVIHSSKRLNYDEAADIMLGKTAAPCATPGALWTLAQLLRRQRRRRGGMLLERPEKFCAVSADNQLQVGEKNRNIAHWAIEEAMILANRCAADFLMQKKRPALHRAHAAPPADKVKILADLLAPLGIRLPQNPAAADFAAALESADERSPALSDVLTPLVLGTLSRAEYTPRDSIGHFGLACARYAHFTSPIRRYPDLLTHRAIIAALQNSDSPFSAEALAGIGAHCSEAEAKADKAGWESRQRLLCVDAQKKIGFEYDGYISGVAPMGFYVAVSELGIDGMVRFSTMAGYWLSDTEKKTVTRKDQNITLGIAEPIKVQLASVMPEKGRVNFIASDYAKK